MNLLLQRYHAIGDWRLIGDSALPIGGTVPQYKVVSMNSNSELFQFKKIEHTSTQRYYIVQY
jgi:hypothetical protein